MKRTFLRLPGILCLTLGLVLSGCSKSQPTPPATGASSNAAPAAPESKTSELKIKWPVGQRYVYRMEIKQVGNTTIPSMPKPMKQEADIVQEYSIKVLNEREPAGRELEMEYLATQMDVNMNGRSVMKFDSAGETLAAENDPIISVFRNFIGMKFKFLLDASNKVEKVEGLDELRNKILLKAPPQAKAMLDGMFGEDMFKNLIDMGKGLPEKPVQPGDSWSTQSEVPAGPIGRMVVDMKYNFEDWETRQDRRCARIGFQGTMTSKDGEAAGPAGMKMNMKEGKMGGTSWFDPAMGMLVEAAIKQDMDLDMTMPIPQLGDKGGGTQTLNSKINQAINLKLVELTAPAP